MTGNEVRRKFLDYFVKNGHREVRSSSLVPLNDPTLLFTNAGMNQFKDVVLGLEQRDYKRAATSQKCVRAGGKHNDLENVGFTNRHLTFFEMLGNFSFGDYFKKEAIEFAWELITKVYGIESQKLYVTIFGATEVAPGQVLGSDHESKVHWYNQGIPKDRIIEIPGLKDNFWAMGDTGPCGPCSELHFDMGPAASDQGHTDCQFPCDCGRFVEIWNLVFMQFNRDAQGALTPLPKPCVDTGMGLERLTTVLQGKFSVYDTDLFQPLIQFAGNLSGKQYGADSESDISMRVLADHSRASAFLISDGVLPANEGRGYVLRKIMRRAIRHGRMLGLEKPFLFDMAAQVAEGMKGAYSDLYELNSRVQAVILSEEKRYEHTLRLALGKLNEEVEAAAKKSPGIAVKKREDGSVEVAGGAKLTIPGEVAFRLYDTYGLSLDVLEDEGAFRGFGVDHAGFERAMEEQRTRAKASWKGAHKELASPVYAKLAETFRTEPDFYFGTHARDCRIEAIVKKGASAREALPGEEAEIVLDRTVIYAESGGQVADTGRIWNNEQSMELAEVRGAYYPVAGLIAHKIVAKEKLALGDRVALVADSARRDHVKRNHTGTHLVHAALRNILGTHVKQAGSLNDSDRLRFDFTHFAALDAEELQEIEQQVNEELLRNQEVATDIMPIDAALSSGALAFFGDRYPEQNVRVVTIPDAQWPRGFYSKELCGGTHVRHIGEIGVVKLVSEQSVAAGVRRVEAVTGTQALEHFQRAAAKLRAVSEALNANEDNVLAAIERLTQQSKQLEKQLDALKKKAAHSKVDDLFEQARDVNGIRVLSARVDDADRAALRQLVDTLRQKLGSGVVVLGTVEGDKVALIVGVTKDLTSRVPAGKIIQETSKLVGGSGGGRPDLAEAGGKDISALETALNQVFGIVQRML